MRMCHFKAQIGPFVLNKFFLVQTIIITFIFLIGPFHCAKLKKSYSGSRVMRMCHFWAQNGPSAPYKFFFGKLLISLSSTYYPHSLCKILKKFFPLIQDAQFLCPKRPICPHENFFRKSVNELCFFHSCLSKCQKSKSDINILMKC